MVCTAAATQFSPRSGFILFAALFIGYFAVNAFTGNHGLRAQADLDQQLATMQGELTRLKAERALWERRVALLRSDRHRPRHAGRAVAARSLGYVDPRDLTLLLHPTLNRRAPARVVHQAQFRYLPSIPWRASRAGGSRFRRPAIYAMGVQGLYRSASRLPPGPCRKE